MTDILVVLAKSGIVSLAIALAVWIIDGYHLGFGWFAVVQIMVSLFMVIIHVVKNQQTELKPPHK
jgi:hypothetical protein